MRVVSILKPKGGCGITTLATNLAQAIHERGQKVLLQEEGTKAIPSKAKLPQGLRGIFLTQHAFLVYVTAR